MMLRSEATMKTLFCLLIVPSNFCLHHVSFSYKYFYFFSCSFGGSEASGMIQNYELKSNVLLHTYHPNHQRNQMFISSAYVKRSQLRLFQLFACLKVLAITKYGLRKFHIVCKSVCRALFILGMYHIIGKCFPGSFTDGPFFKGGCGARGEIKVLNIHLSI